MYLAYWFCFSCGIVVDSGLCVFIRVGFCGVLLLFWMLLGVFLMVICFGIVVLNCCVAGVSLCLFGVFCFYLFLWCVWVFLSFLFLFFCLFVLFVCYFGCCLVLPGFLLLGVGLWHFGFVCFFVLCVVGFRAGFGCGCRVSFFVVFRGLIAWLVGVFVF